jgi:lysophospholipase L1-like esterase
VREGTVSEKLSVGAKPARSGLLLNLILALSAVFIAAGIGEGVLRLKNSSMKNYDIEMWRYAKELKFRGPDPVLDHEHIPNASAILQSVTIRTNSWGLRGDPVPPWQPKQRRILVLGGSITLGWGVPEEQTMTALLQRKFDAEHVDAVVMNAGIGNYNTQRYVELFLRRLTALKPTDIVVHYFLRDAEVLDPGNGNWFLRNSELAVMLWEIWNRVATSSGERSIVDHYRAVYDPHYPGLAVMKQELAKLADYAQQHEIKLYLTMVPDVHDLGHYQLGFAHQIMKHTADQLGYKYLDLLSAFGHLSPEQVWAMPGDPHPNAVGHRLMADAIYPFLQAN